MKNHSDVHITEMDGGSCPLEKNDASSIASTHPPENSTYTNTDQRKNESTHTHILVESNSLEDNVEVAASPVDVDVDVKMHTPILSASKHVSASVAAHPPVHTQSLTCSVAQTSHSPGSLDMSVAPYHVDDRSLNSQKKNHVEIRVLRDYSKGVAVKFRSTSLEDISNNKVPNEMLLRSVERINQIFAVADHTDVYTAADAIMGCLTLYLWFRLKESKYGKQMRILEEFIVSENKVHYGPLDLEMISPLDSGLKYIIVRTRAMDR
eukprot:CFRG1506T1